MRSIATASSPLLLCISRYKLHGDCLVTFAPIERRKRTLNQCPKQPWNRRRQTTMKILIVDDFYVFVKGAVSALKSFGLDAEGMVNEGCMSVPTDEDRFSRRRLTEEEALEMVRGVDVIFLDHEMGGKNGEQMLAYWEAKGINISTKRVIGIGAVRGSQPYLKERLSPECLLVKRIVMETLNI